MKRTRAYRRRQRSRAIARKKRICLQHYGFEYYPFDGMYSKGKIHCSCPMCRGKDEFGEHIWTLGELMAEMKMEEELQDYRNGVLFIEEEEIAS